MNRKIIEDADRLLLYFRNYNLGGVLSETEFESEFRRAHKKIFGFLVLVVEIKNQNKKNETLTVQSFEYLEESFSDMLQSLFAWTNGAYKSSDLLLRSSIENFVKSAIGNIDATIYSEKNVYGIFEKAKKMPMFFLKIGNEKICTMLHRVYGELCRSTHTATVENMESIVAMNSFPKWDGDKSKNYINNINILVNGYMGFYLANYKEIIARMHRVNKDVFFDVIPEGVIKNCQKNMC